MKAETQSMNIVLFIPRFITKFIRYFLIGVKYVFFDCFYNIYTSLNKPKDVDENLEEMLELPQNTPPSQYYKYTCLTKDGQLIKGSILAQNKMTLCNFLASEDLKVIKASLDYPRNFLKKIGLDNSQTFKTKDLIFWLTQISTYLKAGITLNETIKLLIKETQNDKAKRDIYRSISYELTLGESFSHSLESLGHVFPPLLINMIKSAEASGDLISTLEEMANYYTEIDKTKKEMLSAIIYPTILLIFSIVVLTFIMLYVIPEFINVYKQAGITISGFTLTIIKISNFLTSNITSIVLISFAILLILLILYKQNTAFRKKVQYIGLRLPFFGKIFIYHELTIFTKTFSSLLKNSVDIPTSIAILSNITNNEIYKDLMYETITNITKGEKISLSFSNKWYVPDVAYHMLATGEETGELALMMQKVSTYYSSLHKSRVTNLKSFIEPLMIVILALIVGIIILAVVIPMFSLYGQIR